MLLNSEPEDNRVQLVHAVFFSSYISVLLYDTPGVSECRNTFFWLIMSAHFLFIFDSFPCCFCFL